MSNQYGVIVLAAGKGTRMKLDIAKPLAPLAGRKMIDYIIKAVCEFNQSSSCLLSCGVVTGHQSSLVREHLERSFNEMEFSFAHQKELNGTADAVKTFFDSIADAAKAEYTFIVCADTPLITKDVFQKLHDLLEQGKFDAVCASFQCDDPTGYGRVIENKQGKGLKIVEQKDASAQEQMITEVNSGVYLVRTSYLLSRLENINNQNAAGEFYLTDIFDFHQNVACYCFSDASLFLGVNTLEQLQQAENKIRLRKAKELLEKGVRVIDPRHTYIDDCASVEQGAIVWPQSYILGQSKIAKNVEIEMGVVIKDSTIESSSRVLAYSYLEEAFVGENCSIGPHARLRPQTVLHNEVKVGNFVEIKASTLARGSKASHLSYIGDAQIGCETNIGCGFITCNYDGVKKHKTIIGEHCFIGSDTQTIAPLEIGDRCFVASGSTINKSMPADSFAISRSRQETKEGMARRFLKGRD